MKGGLPVAVIVAAVLASAAAVVWSRHEARRLFAELQRLERVRDELQVEWGRLQIEQATWAAQGRIERIARRRLGMRMPRQDEVVIVQP